MGTPGRIVPEFENLAAPVFEFDRCDPPLIRVLLQLPSAQSGSVVAEVHRNVFGQVGADDMDDGAGQ